MNGKQIKVYFAEVPVYACKFYNFVCFQCQKDWKSVAVIADCNLLRIFSLSEVKSVVGHFKLEL